jgi:hypothetical protein
MEYRNMGKLIVIDSSISENVSTESSKPAPTAEEIKKNVELAMMIFDIQKENESLKLNLKRIGYALNFRWVKNPPTTKEMIRTIVDFKNMDAAHREEIKDLKRHISILMRAHSLEAGKNE